MTVTIGIPAHNEEANIANLLNNLLVQTGSSFTLEKIIVFCDGCTDKTADIVSEFTLRDNRVFLVNDGRRLGKLNRLTQLFTQNTSQLVFIFDADVLPADSHVLEQMAQPFIQPRVGLVGGNSRPVRSATLFGQLLNAWSEAWYQVRAVFKNGNNVYNSRGCALAIRSGLAKKIRFPEGIYSDSQYIYFCILSLGKDFIWAKKTVVWYRKPDNLKDYLIQIQRSTPDKMKIIHIFGNQVTAEYNIPRKAKITGLIKTFLNHPLTTVLGALLNLFLVRLEGRQKYSLANSAWITSPSTKKAI